MSNFDALIQDLVIANRILASEEVETKPSDSAIILATAR